MEEEPRLSETSSIDEGPNYFRMFTRDSLKAIKQRMAEEEMKKKEKELKREENPQRHQDNLDDTEGPQPEEKLEQGMPLPIRLAAAFDPSQMAGIPLEDVDPFYKNIPTFVIITKKKEIFRFSATDAVWILSPFNPVRRVAVAILTHGLFSLTIITTILANCYVMIMPGSPLTESTEVIFTAIYTFESAVKVMARGFILEKFTYLRDAWNWLDFVVIAFAYVTMAIDLGNLSALRTCRVFRALKTVAIVPGLKTIVGAVIESVKNLRDVIILTMFALSVFGLVGLQIYMGVLTQKCVRDFPDDGTSGEERHQNWRQWNQNLTNWYPYPPPEEYGAADYPLCGNSSGAGHCPANYTCRQGYGPNPNYGYTSFDSFGWAFLASFRLMTQDFWESLYQQILRTAGPWHMLFFIVIIFLGSYYLVNLILAIVAMSYDELEKKAEAEAMADEAEKEAMREEEEKRQAKMDAKLSKANLKKAASFSNSEEGIDKHEGDDNEEDKPTSYLNGHRNIPYVDDSSVGETPTATPMREKNGSAVILPFCSSSLHQGLTPGGGDSLNSSFNSHFSKRSPSKSQDDQNLNILGSSGLYRRHPHPSSSSITQTLAKDLYYEDGHGSMTNGGFEIDETGGNAIDSESPSKITPTPLQIGSHSPTVTREPAPRLSTAGLDMNDVLVLNAILDQATSPQHRRLSQLSHVTGIMEESPPEPRSLKEIIKTKIMQFSMKCLDAFCLWDCGFPYSHFKKGVAFLVFDAFMELFITLAIVVNTIFMALDHYGLEQNYSMNAVLKIGNKVFTTIFTLECAMKIIAMSPKFFFQVGWNVFDFFIVALSLIEVVFEDANLPGISALRSFRLLRVFKLAKSWASLNMILSIMGQTVGSLTNLVIVLVIIIFIFAVMGMQLFAKNYYENTHLFPGGELPRWNFTDFGHSFMIIFRVLCGEWIESMWDCMLVSGGACVPFFLATVLIGNLVLLNLFLALLLSSFGASNVKTPAADNETNKLAEAFDRIARFIGWVKGGIRTIFTAIRDFFLRAKNQISPRATIPQNDEETPEEVEVIRRQKPRLAKAAKMVINSKRLMGETPKPEASSIKSFESSKAKQNLSEGSDFSSSSDDDELDWSDSDSDETSKDPTQPEVVEEDGPAPCMPPAFYQRFPIFDLDDTPYGDAWNKLRQRMFKLIENPYFETAVIALILLSSLALALEDVHLPDNPVLTDILFYMDRIFTVIFFFEMLIKWVALGFVAYFSNAWCWLDFVIVMVSLVNFIAALAGAGKVQAFKTMRTLRALRPLRAMARMQGMRVVVNALVGAIPSITNVLMVCLIFWLIFAIMGVQLFNGKFHKCVDPEDQSRPDYRIIRNKVECLANNFTWENSVMNFDHVGKAYLCLFQVATFKGWIGIMNDAIDSREIDEQPSREVSFGFYGYFVIFIIFGSFFTLNLFIGVIIDNFNEQQKKSGGSMEMFMTDDQKKYYAAMQKMGSKKPIKAIPKPKWKPQLLVFKLVTNQKFDMVIMVLIGFNMLAMTMDHYQMTDDWDYILNLINTIFISIFTAEACLKMFALRYHYFTEPWNLFDVIVVFLSIAGMVLSDLIEKYFVSPTLLRVVRVAKVGRVLRLVKGAKGIRTLLFALAMSLPALFNICLLLFLVMFIFSIFGMSFFMNVKLRGGLDDVYNFRTFGQSIILLFQMSTSAGWDGVLDGIIDEDDCDDPDPEVGNSGNCGNTAVGIAFLLSYLVISFLIIINMYIAVILDNYSQATEEVQEGLTDDDYDMYYEIWAQFDPDGTQYIKYDELPNFLDVLEPPLQIHKPNKYKIISMNIPICKDDMLYCVDILDSLTKEFFARKGNPVEEAVEITDVSVIVDRPGYEPISTTLFRQREEFCATVIQKTWRKYKEKGKLGQDDNAII